MLYWHYLERVSVIVCERSRDIHDTVSHAPLAAVTKAAGMRRDSDGNPIYPLFMQPVVCPSLLHCNIDCDSNALDSLNLFMIITCR